MATDGPHGRELWKSDGTPTGTTRVKDINTQTGYALPHDLTAVGSTVFFGADDGLHGDELWKTDGTPGNTAMVTNIAAGAAGASIAELTNIGTLLAFVIVCAAVLIMRRRHPEVARPFRCPLVPFVPILGIALCLLLMFSLPEENWLRLVIWLLLGFAVYFGYGRHHSVMARMQNKAAPTEADPA